MVNFILDSFFIWFSSVYFYFFRDIEIVTADWVGYHSNGHIGYQRSAVLLTSIVIE